MVDECRLHGLNSILKKSALARAGDGVGCPCLKHVWITKWA